LNTLHLTNFPKSNFQAIGVRFIERFSATHPWLGNKAQMLDVNVN